MSEPTTRGAAAFAAEEARRAWSLISAANADLTETETQHRAERAKYATQVRRLPARLLSNGLGQTMAFLFSKAELGKRDTNGTRKKSGIGLLYRQLAQEVIGATASFEHRRENTPEVRGQQTRAGGRGQPAPAKHHGRDQHEDRRGRAEDQGRDAKPADEGRSMQVIVDMDLATYRETSRRLLVLSQWMKRFADGTFAKDEEDRQ